MAAGGLGRVVEQAEAIAHEVRERVAHLQRVADGRPRLAVEAVEEARLVRAILEIASAFKNTLFCFSGTRSTSSGASVAGADHHDVICPAFRLHADRAVILLQQTQPREIAVLQVAHVHRGGAANIPGRRSAASACSGPTGNRCPPDRWSAAGTRGASVSDQRLLSGLWFHCQTSGSAGSPACGRIRPKPRCRASGLCWRAGSRCPAPCRPRRAPASHPPI